MINFIEKEKQIVFHLKPLLFLETDVICSNSHILKLEPNKNSKIKTRMTLLPCKRILLILYKKMVKNKIVKIFHLLWEIILRLQEIYGRVMIVINARIAILHPQKFGTVRLMYTVMTPKTHISPEKWELQLTVQRHNNL